MTYFHNRIDRDLGVIIGAKLRFIRRRKGITLRELSPEIGAMPFELGEFERGVRPMTAGMLCRWLIALDVEPSEFFRPPLGIAPKA